MRAWREAEQLAEAARWNDAGDAFRAIAERAARVRDRRLTREAASRAADAFRREDRPAAAAKMLRLALDHGQDGVIDVVQLAAVLLDAGQIEAAAGLVDGAVTGATDLSERVLALDTRVGLRLAAGRVPEARADLDALALLAVPGSEIARSFRSAQIDRLDGLLSVAEGRWHALIGTLARHPQAAGPVGAAWAELGETAALREALGGEGDPLSCFVESAQAWTRAGRRSGLMRAEAWVLRLNRGLPTAIDRAIEYATERGMPLLVAELLVCRAVCKHDATDALEAVRIATEAPLARGRARVLAAELGAPLDGDAARAELAHDAPWTARLLLLDPATSDEGRARAAAFLA